ncbi:MAG: C39 family peptidase [Anaerolineales bacterium]
MFIANLAVISALALLGLSGDWFQAEALAPLPAGEVVAGPATTLPSVTLPAPTTIPLAATDTSVVVPTDIPQPVPTATPLPTLPPALEPVPAPGIPAEAQVTGIGGRAQTLALSCEARSAADWAAYFGVAIDEIEFLNRLPFSDDPDAGFVGNVHGAWGNIPPDDYGVHAMPVAELLKQYGVKARARRGLVWDAVRAEVAAGQPVIAWVVGHVERGGERVLYTASNGHISYVARYEHTVIVIGYTEDSVTVLDGSRAYTRSLDMFLESWLPLGNMAVVYVGP